MHASPYDEQSQLSTAIGGQNLKRKDSPMPKLRLVATLIVAFSACTLTLHGQSPAPAQSTTSSTPSTPGFIPVYGPHGALVNSGIYEGPSHNYGIGTTIPTAQLDVQTSETGISSTTSAVQGAAVQGTVTDESCFNEPCSAGVLGTASLTVHHAGVMGIAGVSSSTGSSINNGAGVWGDTSSAQSGALAVLGTTDNNTAVAGFNNSPIAPSGEFINYNGSGFSVLYAAAASGDGYCNIDASGDLTCTGSTSAVVPVKDSQKVALYAVQSPEHWFEDFGSGNLWNGTANITLDPGFVETVNTENDYHVFLTPGGDCHGLYVAQKTSTGFVVREIGGGGSNVPFDYRIVAKRRGYELIRMANMTESSAKLAATIPHIK
jgi:hypothetical protein